jgi:hypothetical protein
MTVSHHTTAPSVLIRAARGSDGPALERLAILDSSVVPAGELTIAEAGGEIVAALAVPSGDRIADPFHRTNDAVALLELHAARRRSANRRSLAERLGLRPAPRARAA